MKRDNGKCPSDLSTYVILVVVGAAAAAASAIAAPRSGRDHVWWRRRLLLLLRLVADSFGHHFKEVLLSRCLILGEGFFQLDVDRSNIETYRRSTLLSCRLHCTKSINLTFQNPPFHLFGPFSSDKVIPLQMRRGKIVVPENWMPINGFDLRGLNT